MPIRLPDWPAQKIVRESVLSWLLRHPGAPYIDYRIASWPDLVPIVLAFLPHQHSSFDDKLRGRCERDVAYRNQLASEVSREAFRKYPWLSNDPRPFPVSESGKFFDSIAHRLADLHGLRAHYQSALSDLRRAGNHKGPVASLQQYIKKVNRGDRVFVHVLVAPENSHGR